MNDFYGRNDEDGKHRMFTYKNLTGTSIVSPTMCRSPIGDAHSGYPVMNSSFDEQHHAADDAAGTTG
ncbi:hypothetical protein OIU92_21280 [Escherichia coli]|nr:hypothetical protein [Escherichia coli]